MQRHRKHVHQACATSNDLLCRMWKDGVAPTTKTFVSLITALPKGGDDALDVVVQVPLNPKLSFLLHQLSL